MRQYLAPIQRTILLPVLMTVATTCAASWGQEASITPVDPLPADDGSRVTAISGNGATIIGVSYSQGGSERAFRVGRDQVAAGVSGLGPLNPGDDTTAYATNYDGSVVVGTSSAMGSPGQAVRWVVGDPVQSLGDLNPAINGLSEGLGISADGLVVVGVADACMCGITGQAYWWTQESGMVGLGFLVPGGIYSAATGISADASIVVGMTGPLGARQAFYYHEPEGMVGLGDLSSGPTLSEGSLDGAVMSSRATAISADGSAIVGTGLSVLGFEGFRWTHDEGMVPLGDLPGGLVFSEALAVSADGTVIVGFSETKTGSTACLWQNGNLRTVASVLEEQGVDLTGWTLTRASGISNNARILVGEGLYEGQERGWVAEILTCEADTNGDGIVDVGDLINALTDWGVAQSSGDVTADGVVDVLDLLTILEGWGPCR